MSKYVYISFLLLFANIAYTQTWSNNFYGLPEDYDLDKSITQLSRKNHKQKLRTLQNSLIQNGYLAAGIDSVFMDDSLWKIDVYVHSGDFYSFSRLTFNAENEDALGSSGFREKLFSNKPFNPQQLSKLFDKVLTFYENNGFPFASIKLDSITFNNNQLSSNLLIDKGPLIRIDSIFVKGDAQNSNKLIYNILQINPDDIYQQQIISQIEIRIKESPFLQAIKPSEYEFVNNKCNIYVYLKNKPASNFNGIIGLLPDDDGKINITGDVNIKLLNSLHKGETIKLNWRKLQPLTQNLQAAFSYPFLLNSSFGVDTQFSLYKRDTTFLNIDGKIGVQYFFNSDNTLAVFYQNKSSNLLSTQQFQFATALPEFADINNSSYGIEMKSIKLNYKYNPTKGYAAFLSVSAGTKTIRKNNNLNPIVYDDLNLKTAQFGIQSNLDFYIPIKTRSTIKLGSKTGFIFNENMFTNELFRIGGNITLRGFDEESLYNSSFAIGTIEYRFLLEQNSNIFGFIDGAWYENRVKGKFISDTPIGVGAGVNFSTKPGIFSISYALGSQKGSPFIFKSAKIHFGFISFF